MEVGTSNLNNIINASADDSNGVADITCEATLSTARWARPLISLVSIPGGFSYPGCSAGPQVVKSLLQMAAVGVER